MANPGPATTVTVGSVAGLIPLNSAANSDPVLADAYRVLGSVRGYNASVASTDWPILIKKSSRWVPTGIFYAVNSLTTTAASAAYLSAASVAIYTATNAGGTALYAYAAGGTLGASTAAFVTAAVSCLTNTGVTVAYFRTGTTASTTNAYFDVFIVGVDLS